MGSFMTSNMGGVHPAHFVLCDDFRRDRDRWWALLAMCRVLLSFIAIIDNLS